MANDLWLMLLGPVLIAGIAGLVWLFDRFFGDCQHKWDGWQPDVEEYAYVQHRKCVKCGFIQTHQLRKMYKNEQIKNT